MRVLSYMIFIRPYSFQEFHCRREVPVLSRRDTQSTLASEISLPHIGAGLGQHDEVRTQIAFILRTHQLYYIILLFTLMSTSELIRYTYNAIQRLIILCLFSIPYKYEYSWK